MNKCHSPIGFHNNTNPALSEAILNYLDGCVETLDNRVVALANDPPENALKAEGYANGTQNGIPVGRTSPYYNNNAKYWKEQAQAIATETLDGLSNVSISNPSNGQVLAFQDGYWVNDNSSVDISSKADKVTGAVNGHFASLDSTGNLVDSGKSSSDFVQVSNSALTAKVLANATAVQTLGDKQVRNIYFGTDDMTPGVSALPTGDIYIMYE